VSREVFPPTRHSAVLALQSDDPEVRSRCHDRIASVYYRPVYTHVRLRWRKTPDEALDLTQVFFEFAFESGLFAAYDPSRGRFRTYVRFCLDRVVAKQALAERRLKRGGHLQFASADVAEIENEIGRLAAHEDIESHFDREWTRSLFASSVAELRSTLERAGKTRYFQVFERYELDDTAAERPSYAVIAEQLGVKVTDVTNYLHAARRELRKIVLVRLREITGSEEEFRDEARAVLGIEVDQA
jgi:DNA-directed RNA polymerase specialized sigma24 family protein